MCAKAHPAQPRRAHVRPYDPQLDPMIARWASQNRHTGYEIATRLGTPGKLLRKWRHIGRPAAI